VSFAAGIDRANFADAVALGLVPITVCSDLLKPFFLGPFSRVRVPISGLRLPCKCS
jgi:hypothetical protein